jgi:hypothetical protein
VLETYTGTAAAPLCHLDPSRVQRTTATDKDGTIVVRYPMVLAGEGSEPVR